MFDLEQFISGYIDALKDSGQWLEMTKDQKLEAGKEALEYGQKMEFHFRMIHKILKNDE